MKTVSIVIPVYNCAAYLSACLDSVLGQTYVDTEIILVENGSTDESPRICTEYAQEHSKIQLIQGPKRGPGAARNEGLRAATGEYVIFIDSDDICEPELVSRLMEAGAAKSRTLVICGIQVVDEHNVSGEVFRENDTVCDTASYVSGVLAKWKTNPLCGGVYCKLFELSILREAGILFEEDATYAEDFCFNMAYLRCVENVVVLPDLLYRYRCGRPGSVTEKNLREAEYAAMWQRRLAVVDVFRSVFEQFGLEDKCSADIAAFYWFQVKDTMELAVRRASDYGAFRSYMEEVASDLDGKRGSFGEPSGMPPKDIQALSWLVNGKYRRLWAYEKMRRTIRILRGRERW